MSEAGKELTKIIIVDDDPDILQIAFMSLEEMPGVTVKCCQSGQKAIEEALIFQPDLMLIDVMMPNMDGIALLNAMKLIPSLSKIPVAFLTARIQKDEVEEYYKLGAKEVITKPFNPMTLPDTIQTLWKKIQS